MPAATKTKFAETSSVVLRGFFGGLNIRDAPDELAPGESPDLYNVVLDERGGFGSRLGYVKYNAAVYPGGLVSNIFEWHKGGHVVAQAGPSLYLDSSIVPFKTFSTADRCGFAEFAGKLWAIHPIDGLWYSDGTPGGTIKSLTGPAGTTLAVWQNRLWANVTGTPRLVYSAIGSGDQWTPQQTTLNGAHNMPQAVVTVASTAGYDPTGSFTIGVGAGADVVTYTGLTATTFTGCSGGTHAWPTGTVVTQGTNYNDVIEKDEQPIVCLKGASGQDVIGQPGLIVFKQRSAYRVNDPDTGAYTTLDPEIGCASNIGAIVVEGRVYTISEAGICYTDGNGPMRSESDKLRPLWDQSQLAFDRLDLWCAGRRDNRVKFSVPTRGKAACDLALEHYPSTKPENAATVIGSDAASCYALLGAPADVLLAGSPTVNGQAYQHATSGADDTAPIHAWFQTAWGSPHPERLTRIRSATLEGRGDFTVYVKIDYSRAQGAAGNVQINRGGFRWNSFLWNDGSKWGPDSFAGFSNAMPSLGVCRVLSFRCEATTTTTKATPGMSSTGAGPPVGAWGVYAIHLKTVPLRQI